jgi:pilus assembly protein CpaE
MSDQQQKIRLLVVDDTAETRNLINNLLYFEKDVQVVGQAMRGLEGVDMAKKLQPDIVLMDINMPDIDGIQATERIMSTVSGVSVIMMSVQGEQDYLRRAMRAGASEFLVKPFSGDDLISTIRQVYANESSKRRFVTVAAGAGDAHSSQQEDAKGQIISIFSPKGGVGRTTIITNLAIAVKQLTKKRVALVDASLFFGDVGLVLDVRNIKTISDLNGRIDQLDSQLLSDVLMTHSSEVKILLAPPKPEQAELVTAEDLKKILQQLKRDFDYVLVDTFPSLKEETQLAVLDVSDLILTVMTLEMPSIKDVRLFLEVADLLEYPRDKIALLLNRADSKHGLRADNIEQIIRHPIAASLVSSGAAVTLSINQGTPLIIDVPDNPFSRDIANLAREIVEGTLVTDKKTAGGAAKAPVGAGAGGKNGNAPAKAKSGGFFGLFRAKA